MVKDAENKSSLKCLRLSEARYGHCHNIWSSCGTEPFAVTMAAVNVRLATGTLILQEHKAKFARKGRVQTVLFRDFVQF
jgi:HSP90 family molecular chaperone